MNTSPQLPIDIRPAVATDAPAIVDIYNHFVRSSVVSFEEQVVTADTMLQRMGLHDERSWPWVVANNTATNELLGYAYASTWRARSAYRHTAEISVYTRPESAGAGIGTKLYAALFNALQNHSIRMLVATVALPNDASIALHEKFGLEKVAHYPQVGFKFDRWVDIGVWQGRLPTARLP